jgi:hypothetical protein
MGWRPLQAEPVAVIFLIRFQMTDTSRAVLRKERMHARPASGGFAERDSHTNQRVAHHDDLDIDQAFLDTPGFGVADREEPARV